MAVVLDLTEGHAITGATRRGGIAPISLDWMVGDAMALPFEDNKL